MYNIAHYTNDQLHSIDDAPAIIYSNGDKYWYKEGKRHRENGPAFITFPGYREYYYNGALLPKIKTNKELEAWIKFKAFL